MTLHAVLWGRATAPARFYEHLLPRKSQIFALEVLAVLVALILFLRVLGPRPIVILVNNTFALVVLVKGRSRATDVHSLVSFCWESVLSEFSHVKFL